ncbi:MAG: ribosome hibernation-promoting factor, HPF/YfiA family [Rhodospirillales bacterium]|nr:ribosome-associated translation inhibitor RaiA [Rhodospirillales bacterium]
MDISINGKGLDIGDALRGHVGNLLTSIVSKYFPKAHDAMVTVSREAHLFRADVTVHPTRGFVVQGRGAADDAYAAVDAAVERIGKQLRRYKRRLNDHHGRRPAEDGMPAQQYIIAAESDEEELPAEGQPAIIAEIATEIATMSVGEAVMRMDLADAPAMIFNNRATGGLNVIYRRADGNIGWIDPANTRKA